MNDNGMAWWLIPVCLMIVACSSPRQEDMPNGKTRGGVVSGTELILVSWDEDKDARLSRTEWTRMADGAARRDAAGGSSLRSAAGKYFTADDTDRDGFLTREELLRPVLATFDCLDSNRSGILSDAEISRGGTADCPGYDMQGGTLG